MDDLIEALTIAKKYADEYGMQHPTNCAHDEMYLNIRSEDVSVEDIARLDELSFVVDEEFDGFISYRFGSC